MELIPLLCLLFPWFGAFAHDIKNVTVPEGENALLNCTLNSGQKIDKFDWRKDNGKDEKIEVFSYQSGLYHGTGLPGQHDQFKDRVDFFKEELKSGNASIIIKNTRLEDNGTYTCGLVERYRPVRIRLNVGGVLKIRHVTGAARLPYIQMIRDKTTWRLLECKVTGVPEPEVEWRNSAGEVLEKHNPKSQDQRSHVELPLKVTKSDNYTCVVTQRDIYHQINNTMEASFPEHSGVIVTVVIILSGVLLLVLIAIAVVCCKFRLVQRVTIKDPMPGVDGEHQHLGVDGDK